MPPTNITALTATVVTADTDVTVDVTGLAAPYTTWYKYLVRSGEKLISAWARPETIVGTNNNARFTTYLGPAASPVVYDFGDSDLNRPKIQPLTSSYPTMTPLATDTEIFFEVYWSNASSPNRSLKFTVYGEEVSTIPAQAIIVSSDGEPFPLVGLGWDGTIYGFIHHSNGEGGAMMTGGINAHTNKTNGNLDVYSSSHSLVNSLDLTPAVGSNTSLVSSDRSSKFYVNYPGVAPYSVSPGVIHVVSNAGVLLNTITFAGMGVFKHAPNWSNTILYLTTNSGTTVKRWDLVGSVFLSDLYTLPANTIFKNDLLVMEDGSILVPTRQTVSPFAENVVHLDTSGAIINTISLGSGLAGVGTFLLNRSCNSYEGNKFVVWLRDTSILNRFKEYHQDGTLIRTSPDFEQFDVDGDSDTVVPYDSMAHFGPFNSCPVMVAAAVGGWPTDGFTPVGPGDTSYGLFKIVPDKRTDHNGNEAVKIPNPTFRTGLIP
jgi:hypothetical protein